MKIHVQAKPGAKQDKIEKLDDTHYKIWVKVRPDEGKANRAILELLSSHLGVPKSSLSVAVGHQSRNKVIRIQP